jgi:CMP-N-acetylneuraminic acid synthetase/spore coat polysaccharide biosynthesis predicted glycosyltransferase SpsG
LFGGKKFLVVIPARGGSKGIPRKNLRIINGKPLIAYVIEASKNAKLVDKVVLTTDDEEIRSVGGLLGVSLIDRPIELAGDAVPLDPVIHHAVIALEANGEKFDYVISLQPTLPLITPETIDSSVKRIVEGDADTLIGLVDATHLYWKRGDEAITPMFKERKNRQYLDKIYKECGFFISRRSIVTPSNRISGKIIDHVLPERETIDVDTYEDLWVVEGLFKRCNIAIRVDGNEKIGLGHIYRVMSLASRLIYHNVKFYIRSDQSLGIALLKENNFKIQTVTDNSDFIKCAKRDGSQIAINDILDTDADYINALRKEGFYVVNFEDLGEGSSHANMVFNALYENTNPEKNNYFGYCYEILRQDFYYYPTKPVSKRVENILLTFGGVDENNLTLRSLQALEGTNYRGKVTVVLGIGYRYSAELERFISESRLKPIIYHNVRNMAHIIYEADLVLTSNGRTIYEVSSLGIPSISISQNEREVKHLFADVSKGIENLGLAIGVTSEKIRERVQKNIDDYTLRERRHKQLTQFNLKHGVDNVINLILNGYYAEDYARN